MSLLEMMAAAAITATLMASSTVVIRSSYAAWEAHEGDLQQLETAHAVLRHFVRGVRQCSGVTSITTASDPEGRLEVVDAAGGTQYWEHTGDSNGTVNYSSAGAVLARGITEMYFVGYHADGVTATTVTADIQLLECTVKVTLPRGAGQTRTMSCRAWVRSW